MLPAAGGADWINRCAATNSFPLAQTGAYMSSTHRQVESRSLEDRQVENRSLEDLPAYRQVENRSHLDLYPNRKEILKSIRGRLLGPWTAWTVSVSIY